MSVWTRVAFERAETNWNSRHAPLLPLRRPPHLFVWLYCAVLYHSLRFSAIVCECEASIVGRESENCHRPPKKTWEMKEDAGGSGIHQQQQRTYQGRRADPLPFLSSISAGNGG